MKKRHLSTRKERKSLATSNFIFMANSMAWDKNLICYLSSKLSLITKFVIAIFDVHLIQVLWSISPDPKMWHFPLNSLLDISTSPAVTCRCWGINMSHSPRGSQKNLKQPITFKHQLRKFLNKKCQAQRKEEGDEKWLSVKQVNKTINSGSKHHCYTGIDLNIEKEAPNFYLCRL